MNKHKELALTCIGVADDDTQRDIVRQIAVNEAIAYAVLYVGDCLPPIVPDTYPKYPQGTPKIVDVTDDGG